MIVLIINNENTYPCWYLLILVIVILVILVLYHW